MRKSQGDRLTEKKKKGRIRGREGPSAEKGIQYISRSEERNSSCLEVNSEKIPAKDPSWESKEQKKRHNRGNELPSLRLDSGNRKEGRKKIQRSRRLRASREK